MKEKPQMLGVSGRFRVALLTPVNCLLGLALLPTISLTANNSLAVEPRTEDHKPGEERSFGSLKLAMCWCPSGTFVMGSPLNEPKRHASVEDQVEVTLTQGFCLGKFEVTQEDYRRVMSVQPSKFKGKRLPVETVSWKDATEFCRKLTAMDQAANLVPEGWEYRLPTEAEWEYACRAGVKGAYSYGSDAGRLGDYAWFVDNSGGQPHEAGRKKQNTWGLHDMHGNVWEWCQDGQAKPLEHGGHLMHELLGGADPETVGNDFRVIRGGCWSDFANHCRSAQRWIVTLEGKGSGLGFRVALFEVK